MTTAKQGSATTTPCQPQRTSGFSEAVILIVNGGVLYYTNQKGTRTAEFLEFVSDGEGGESCGELRWWVEDFRLGLGGNLWDPAGRVTESWPDPCSSLPASASNFSLSTFRRSLQHA